MWCSVTENETFPPKIILSMFLKRDKFFNYFSHISLNLHYVIPEIERLGFGIFLRTKMLPFPEFKFLEHIFLSMNLKISKRIKRK